MAMRACCGGGHCHRACDARNVPPGRCAVHLGDLEFDLTRESWGFAAKQRGDNDNVIYFRRQ